MKICLVCNNHFDIIDRMGRKITNKKYCSRKCSEKVFRYNKLKKCERCGKTISNRARYCLKCAFSLRDYNDEKNPRYKHGMSAGKIKNTVEGILQKNHIPKLCSFCKATPTEKEIHVHHIDHNRSNNNLENLMYVCISCHAKIHNPNTGEYITCANCGQKTYVIKSLLKHKKHFCSRKCYIEYLHKRDWRKDFLKKREKTCLRCKKRFETVMGNFCQECKVIKGREANRENYKKYHFVGKYKKICPYCKKEFETNAKGKVCTPLCGIMWRKYKLPKDVLFKKKCVWCRKEYIAHSSNQKYCSKKCGISSFWKQRKKSDKSTKKAE